MLREREGDLNADTMSGLEEYGVFSIFLKQIYKSSGFLMEIKEGVSASTVCRINNLELKQPK